ncbi:MAG: glycosyltransferase family 39 protein [bacterium]|nr:glycosyltransferase family 39 protein [bacterium]
MKGPGEEMLYINLIALVTIVALLAIYRTYFELTPVGKDCGKAIYKSWTGIAWLLAFALIIKLIISVIYTGFDTDMNCFFSWARMAANDGLSNFYREDVFTDYPPGYIYVLFVVGKFISLFNVESYASVMGILLVKFPAILCDVMAGYLIYKIARKRFTEKTSLICTLLYVLNPVVILDSSIWGQVDSVYTLFVLLMCYFITENKYPYAIISFAIGVLMKPQTVFFTPVLLFACIEKSFITYRGGKLTFEYHSNEFVRLLIYSIASIIGMIVLVLPFGVGTIIAQYTETMGSYPYASVNAYNIWMLFGKNWVAQTETILGIPYVVLGYFVIIATVAIAGLIFFKSKRDDARIYMVGAFINIFMFLFSVRMHERYMFPALVLLLCAYLARPHKELFFVYGLFSITSLYNVAHVLFFYDATNYDWEAKVPKMISFATVLVFGLLMYAIWKYFFHDVEVQEVPIQEVEAKEEQGLSSRGTITPSTLFERLTKKDFLIMFGITAVYAAIALYNLGFMYAPESSWATYEENATVDFDFGSTVDINKMSAYLGNYEGRKFEIEYRNSENEEWNKLINPSYDASEEQSDSTVTEYTFELSSVFCWNSLNLDVEARYLRLISKSEKAVINELVFLDANGVKLIPANSEQYTELFDEQDMYEPKESYRSGTYFDEIYHARTGYEFLHGLYTYEWTHPPFGKILIATGMAIFGVNPFGWRIMGTLFGIAMLPLIYVFARRLFKKQWFATMACLLFACDFMHFAQTRIATIDVFVTFFIMLMYYFMYRYISSSFFDTDLKKTFIPLGLCGITMGFAIASKMTGVYAAAGLAVIFFVNLYKRFKEYQFAMLDPKGTTNGISHEHVVKHFYDYTWKTIAFCFVVFIFIPAIIYTLSYIPFRSTEGMGLIDRMIKNQSDMFNYHAHLDATHPFSSNWYEWPIVSRPIWYYSGDISATTAEGISSFGNPFIWWMGIIATFGTLGLAYKKKDRTAAFLFIGYLAQYLPWMLVTRCTFIYHYFPSVPFVILMIAYCAKALIDKNKKFKVPIAIYVLLCIVLFFMFYPVLSGMTVSKEYVNHFLRWRDSWVLLRR